LFSRPESTIFRVKNQFCGKRAKKVPLHTFVKLFLGLKLKNQSGSLAQGKRMKVSPLFLRSNRGFGFSQGSAPPPRRAKPIFGPLAVALGPL
jgi:hypothetical protein